VIDLVFETTHLNQKIVQVNGKIFADPKIGQWIANILGITLQYVSGDDASLVGAGVLVEGARLRESLSFSTIEPDKKSREKYHQKFLNFKSYADLLDQSSRTTLY